MEQSIACPYHYGMRRLFALFTGLWITAFAIADEAGYALAEKRYNRSNGRDSSSIGQMILTEKGHSPRTRELVIYRMDKSRTETAGLIRFLEPEDIAGTGLLTLDKPGSDADQWLYLPALDKVRRISGSRKGGRFVGSDLYYEDLQERHPDKDEHRILGKETINGVACDILESIPLDEDNSAYNKRIAWIDPKTLLPMRIDFFEKNPDTPSKRLALIRKEKIQGYWTVMESRMTDLKSGHETQLILNVVQYDRKLPASLFTTQTLADENQEAEYRP